MLEKVAISEIKYEIQNKNQMIFFRANCASLVAFCDVSVHEGNKMDGISHDLSNISEIISCSILIAKLERYGLDGLT